MQTLDPDPQTLTWPPPYSVRISKRAKYAHLEITLRNGLEVVVPTHYTQSAIEDLLRQKRRWIEKHLPSVLIRKDDTLSYEKPTTLTLRALDETWQLEYTSTLDKRIKSIALPEQRLALMGNFNDEWRWQKALNEWLKLHAERNFYPWLERLAAKHGLAFKDLQVRGQKTRWGSCSSDKEISLNYKLLFLPRSLAQHILLHELCHTRYMNHSRRFWQLLMKMDPDSSQHRHALRTAERYMPNWID